MAMSIGEVNDVITVEQRDLAKFKSQKLCLYRADGQTNYCDCTEG